MMGHCVWIKVLVLLEIIFKAAGKPALLFELKEPDSLDFDSNEISLLEDTNFVMTCHHTEANQMSKWTQPDNNNFYSSNSLLSFKPLQKRHAGNYTCSSTDGEYSRILTLTVLYPANDTMITGPYKVEAGSSFSLSCFADSVPQPSYWWTTDPYQDSLSISSDSMITVQHADREDYWFYCFAQNTMVPTVEETRISAIISRARHVVVEGHACPNEMDNTWAVIATTMGWIVCVGVLVILFLYRMRRKILKLFERKVCDEKKDRSIELSTFERHGDETVYEQTNEADNMKTKLTVACQTAGPSHNIRRCTEQTAKKENFMTILDSGAFGSYEKF